MKRVISCKIVFLFFLLNQALYAKSEERLLTIIEALELQLEDKTRLKDTEINLEWKAVIGELSHWKLQMRLKTHVSPYYAERNDSNNMGFYQKGVHGIARNYFEFKPALPALEALEKCENLQDFNRVLGVPTNSFTRQALYQWAFIGWKDSKLFMLFVIYGGESYHHDSKSGAYAISEIKY